MIVRKTRLGAVTVVVLVFGVYLLTTTTPRQKILLQETITPVNAVAPVTSSAVYPRKPPPPWKWSAPSYSLPFNCTHGTRQVPAVTDHTRFHLIFLGKPRNFYLSSFCSSRGYAWRLVPDPHSVSTLSALVPNSHIFPIILTSSYAYSYRYMKQFVSNKSGLVMSLKRAHKVTGSKSVQLLAYRREFERFGCHLEDSQLMPPSFLLHEPKECQAFFDFARSHQGVWWVLKPEHGQGGDGITVHGDVRNMSERFGTCSVDNERYVVQTYIPHLLLLDNHKFDVRAFVLIASTAPFLLFYHDGYLRVTIKEFSHDLSDLGRHLTNTHYQKGEHSFTYDAHLWSFRHLQTHLQVRHPERKHFVKKELVPFIKNVGRFLLGAGQGTWLRLPGSFQLLGLDFLITSSFEIKFLEANNYPLWPTPSADIEHMLQWMTVSLLKGAIEVDHCQSDLFDLLISLHQNPNPFVAMKMGDRFGSWELIGSEIEERCNSVPAFNPCEAFQGT